ncbi:PIN domain-containing protein [Sphingomonas sp. MAH-20]|uniref:Ribonuclease VapC n=1 Tax=Sphingomonas horti TaxID=2682842 RepID=A0A6I4IZV3_9SPHN|nr:MULTISPECIES: PIN domain-containing protein [Sphingomonas]MBA2920769.1 PIN domain-containing protein [Sphingomonas sp. CGMCC 1.13658]MVO77705.1 PIN domain-containing protein [Sphingomonas horti]
MARAFLDTNVLVYAFADDPRATVAERLLAEGNDVSVQVLNEFANVARRKLGFDWRQVRDGLASIRALARAIHPVDLKTHTHALWLAERYGLSVYDALIVAAALQARCDLLYSEDMQNGMEIEGGLCIRNPFTNQA